MKRSLLVLALVTTAAADARPFSFASKTKYAQVEYSWSAEAAAVPALVKKFKAELARQKVRMPACGHEESAARSQGGSPVTMACSSVTKVTTSGQTSRLLSLAKADWSFTGGAHGNGATHPLLWDRRLGKEVKFASLFRKPDGFAAALRAPYCDALTAERRKRRGPDWQPNSITPEFDSCPSFSDLSLIPSGSGHFQQVHVIAAPYEAGPYSEGEYDVALPVTPALISALKSEYRASFAAQRQ